jgi:hypothetical protein
MRKPFEYAFSIDLRDGGIGLAFSAPGRAWSREGIDLYLRRRAEAGMTTRAPDGQRSRRRRLFSSQRSARSSLLAHELSR